MNIPILEIGLAVVLVVAVLQWRFMVQMRQRISALQIRLVEKGEQAAAIQAATIPAEQLAASLPYIKIELDNPLAVAEQEVSVGGVAGAVAPALVKKRVFQDVRKELAKELQSRKIAARVSVQLDVKEGNA